MTRKIGLGFIITPSVKLLRNLVAPMKRPFKAKKVSKRITRSSLTTGKKPKRTCKSFMSLGFETPKKYNKENDSGNSR